MSVSNLPPALGFPANVLRLVGSIRLSRHRGDADPSTSPERQEAAITTEAVNRNGVLVGWARDLDVSAIKLSPFKRPQLGAWLSPNRASDFDGIVWSRLDRAVRSMADLHTLAQWATTNRKVLIFVSGPGGGSMMLDMRAGPLDPIPHLIVTILAFAAQMEAQAITERTKESKAYLRSVGRWSGGMYPYHLIPVRDGNGWRLANNPETLPILEEIIFLRMRGESNNAIASYLNKEGVPSPREYRMQSQGKVCVSPIDGWVEEMFENADNLGVKAASIHPHGNGDPELVPMFPANSEWAVGLDERVDKGQRLTLPLLWNPKTIKEMLSDRVLLGETTLDGNPVLGPDGMPVKRAEPVMSREDWTRLQALLDHAAASHVGRRSTGASMLLDIAYCALCGEGCQFRAQPKPNSKRGVYPYYNCRSAWGYLKRQSKEERCSSKGMDGDVLESIVERLLMDAIGDELVLTPITTPREDHGEELAAASEALADLIQRSAGKGAAVAAIYAGQIEALERKITELSALPTKDEQVVFQTTGKTYRQLWTESDRADRRRLLLESGVRVECRKVGSSVIRPGQRRNGPEPGFRVGLFERPSRYDASVAMTIENDVQVAMYLPADLRERAGGKPGVPLGYGGPSMLL